MVNFYIQNINKRRILMKDKLSFVLLLLPLIFVLSCSQGDVGPTGPTGEDAAVLQFQ